MQEQILPPYLSINKFDDLFDLLSSLSFTSISKLDLLNREFSDFSAGIAISSLKFLQIIDYKGNATENIKIFSLKGEDKKIKLQNLIKSSYKKIFNRVTDIKLLSKENLYNEFLAEYGLSRRVAEPAISAFIWLCEQADIKLNPDIKKLNINTNKKISLTLSSHALKKVNNQMPKPSVPATDKYVVRIAQSGIELHLPDIEQVHDEIVAGGLAQAREELIKFAEKVGLISNNTAR